MIERMCRYAIEANFGWPVPPVVKPEFDVHDHLANLGFANERSGNQLTRPPKPSSNGEAMRRNPNSSDNELASPAKEGDRQVFLGLQVNGRGGGQWELVMARDDGAIVAALPGLSDRCTATFYLNSQTFEGLTTGTSTVESAIKTGRVLIEGNGVPLSDLAMILESVATGGS